MMACVSLGCTVRSTPFRVSFVALSVSTVTCRSRISSVAMGASGLLVEGDEHVVPFDLYGVYGDGARRGKAGRLAGAEVERGAVQPALDLAVLHLALGERDVRVRADVVDSEHLALGADDRDRRAVEFHPLGGVLLQLAEPTGAQVRRRGSHQTDASSSSSIFTRRRSWMSSTPICWTSSAKKPRTTRRRASSAGMPRAIR